jgi:hypothetical protein
VGGVAAWKSTAAAGLFARIGRAGADGVDVAAGVGVVGGWKRSVVGTVAVRIGCCREVGRGVRRAAPGA